MAAVAPPATAATVMTDGARITYTADAGEVNSLTVSQDALDYVFTDTTAPVSPGLGCAAGPTPNVAVCPRAGTLLVVVDLGDLDDGITLDAITSIGFLERGGAGADTLRGSSQSASTTMIGGEGTDTYVNGVGFDAVGYSDRSTPITASLDDQPNDPDGENVPHVIDGLGGGGGGDTLIGSGELDYLFGGDGDDTLEGGGGPDGLRGDAGADTLNGGDADDDLIGGAGPDTLNGGDGLDAADYSDRSTSVNVTLDGAPGDGTAGENDRVAADVEDITGSPSPDTLTGNDGANAIAGAGGGDTITGGGGEDALAGGSGDDTIRGRDGFADGVGCGSGTDSAEVDQLDRVQSDCETVARADAGVARDVPEDRPPAVAFAAPAEGALLGTRSPARIAVTASDDRQVARVVLLDDGRAVGTDATAPYEFRYRPRGDDVGSDALTAIAYDSAGQTATALRRVRVDRFLPGLRTRVRPGRDRGAPFRFAMSGSLRRPAGVTRAQGCGSGSVRLQARLGGRTLAARAVKLRRTCGFSGVITLRSSSRHRGSLRVGARFLGNRVLKPRTGRSLRVRAG